MIWDRLYIKAAGGYSESANQDYVLLIHEDGSVQRVSTGWGSGDVAIQGGDQIMVPSKTVSQSVTLASAISQIIYQVAVAAKVALDF